MAYYAGRSCLSSRVGRSVQGIFPVICTPDDPTPIGTASLLPEKRPFYLFQIYLKGSGTLLGVWYLDKEGQFHPFDEGETTRNPPAVRPYYANAWPCTGPVKYRDGIGPYDVLNAPDDRQPVGTARCAAWDDRSRAVWKLEINGRKEPGGWVIIDCEFGIVQWEPTEMLKPQHPSA